jgi:hypothetical protein
MVKIKTGLKIIENYSYVEFGKFIIQTKLLNDNILLVKYLSYSPVPTIKRMDISDDLRDVILNIIDTSEINYQLAKTLESSEKAILNKLIVKSGLKDQLNYKPKLITEHIKDIINDYNILRGIIIAGNNNPDVIDKLKSVLTKLVIHKKITQVDADEMLKEII